MSQPAKLHAPTQRRRPAGLRCPNLQSYTPPRSAGVPRDFGVPTRKVTPLLLFLLPPTSWGGLGRGAEGRSIQQLEKLHAPRSAGVPRDFGVPTRKVTRPPQRRRPAGPRCPNPQSYTPPQRRRPAGPRCPNPQSYTPPAAPASRGTSVSQPAKLHAPSQRRRPAGLRCPNLEFSAHLRRPTTENFASSAESVGRFEGPLLALAPHPLPAGDLAIAR